MRQSGNHSQYGRSHTYNGNRTYGRRVNKKRMAIFIIILAVGLIVLFACVGNAVAENKKNETHKQLSEYGLKMLEQEVLPALLDEMRGEGLTDLNAQAVDMGIATQMMDKDVYISTTDIPITVEERKKYVEKYFYSDEKFLTLICDITFHSNDIDQYANVERDSNEAIQLYNMAASMLAIKDIYFYDSNDKPIEYSYELEGVGTVVIRMKDTLDSSMLLGQDNSINLASENGKQYLTIHSENNVYNLAQNNDMGGNLGLNGTLIYKMDAKTSSSSNSSGISAKQVWNYCMDRQYEYFVAGGMTDSQIEQQSYEDAANHFGISVSEVKRLYREHANLLSGSGSNKSSATSDYDSDYQSNLEKIADAYGVSPEEVDAKIKAVTGE